MLVIMPYCYGKLTNEVNETLKLDLKLVTTWFHGIFILLNCGKCNYMCLGSKTEKAEFLFDGKIFESSKGEKLTNAY